MEVVPSNFVGKGNGVLKRGLNDNMNAQQCQTNWNIVKCMLSSSAKKHSTLHKRSL
jgi:hypothetical protein